MAGVSPARRAPNALYRWVARPRRGLASRVRVHVRQDELDKTGCGCLARPCLADAMRACGFAGPLKIGMASVCQKRQTKKTNTTHDATVTCADMFRQLIE